ncbi:protein of unknown function [Pedobacter sp. ok626]|uniref:DUF4843 domain-containing protein n=1 Tax=Pedobacter sp. ok626 TaxID=1761882 RepID=UPI000884BB0B|nr:DUF4843 domain-containing protein [Pedobacter sp. ok626]SDL86944.1 protein of unknown function [Pedobacter sp. ok626]
MKRLIYFLIILLAAAVTSCTKTDYLYFNDSARVQLNDTSTITSTFFYEPNTVLRDTVYIQVNTIGDVSNKERAVKLVQVVEPGVLNPAVPGVHYVAMDDPALKHMMVVKGNQVNAMIPVVLLRDASLRTNSFRLRLELAGNDQFGLGEKQSRSCAVVFSDRLERFYSWRTDTGVSPAVSRFGKYSTRKHQFMYDFLKVKIDEAWYQALAATGALDNYKNALKEGLNEFNSNPANIANGTAPMRETNVAGSPLVTFP